MIKNPSHKPKPGFYCSQVWLRGERRPDRRISDEERFGIRRISDELVTKSALGIRSALGLG